MVVAQPIHKPQQRHMDKQTKQEIKISENGSPFLRCQSPETQYVYDSTASRVTQTGRLTPAQTRQVALMTATMSATVCSGSLRYKLCRGSGR